MARISMRDSIGCQSVQGKARKIANNTFEFVRPEDGARVIRLHRTNIIQKYRDGRVRLNTGGWQTVTTKNRFNRFAPCTVYSNAGVWMVRYHGQEYAYADGMLLLAGGLVMGEGVDPNETKKLRAKVRKYAQAYAKALWAGEISAPSAGDCWYCALRDKDGEPWGGRDHIIAHMDESYFVPSLLVNAVTAFGASKIMRHNIACMITGKVDQVYRGSYEVTAVAKLVRRYCYRALGLAT